MTELNNEAVEQAADEAVDTVERNKSSQRAEKPKKSKKKGGFFGTLIKLILLALVIGALFYVYTQNKEGGFSGLFEKGKQMLGFSSEVEEVETVEQVEVIDSVDSDLLAQMDGTSEIEQTSASAAIEEMANEAMTEEALAETGDAVVAEVSGETEVMTEAEIAANIEQAIEGSFDEGVAEFVNTEADEGSVAVASGFDVEQQFETLKQEQQALLASVEETLSSSTKELKLREAASLVKLANQANLLNKDATSAMSLLVAADEALAETQGINVTEVRQTLSDAILELKAASKVDIEGMFLKLDSASKAIASLPMQPKYAIEPEAELTEESSLGDRFGYAVSKVFQVRTVSESVKPLLAADQMAQVKQNFSLSIAQAKLALMQQQPEIFTSSVESAKAVVSDFLDAENPVVQTVEETLSDLATQTILPETVDLSDAVAAVSDLQATKPPRIIISSPAEVATEE